MKIMTVFALTFCFSFTLARQNVAENTITVKSYETAVRAAIRAQELGSKNVIELWEKAIALKESEALRGVALPVELRWSGTQFRQVRPYYDLGRYY
ncbi:MAG: hypothetical protein ABL958_04550, partial [Bdellovibrionia bacterium]